MSNRKWVCSVGSGGVFARRDAARSRSAREILANWRRNGAIVFSVGSWGNGSVSTPGRPGGGWRASGERVEFGADASPQSRGRGGVWRPMSASGEMNLDGAFSGPPAAPAVVCAPAGASAIVKRASALETECDRPAPKRTALDPAVLPEAQP